MNIKIANTTQLIEKALCMPASNIPPPIAAGNATNNHVAPYQEKKSTTLQ
jgi:hypothetical protein